MNDNDRVFYSSDEMIVSLEGYLENLKILRYDSRYKMLLGEEFISRLVWWDKEIRQRKEDPFTVVVVGDFKRGKSMLINALLGEEVAPVNVTPETVTLNRISYGAHSSEAVLSGNRRLRLSDEELSRSELEGVLSNLGEKVERLELKRENPLLKKMTVIDTPGLGDALQDFSELVKESLLQADAVIYVFSAMYPLSMSEQIFLRSAVIPQKYTTLFMAANFTDMLRSREAYERVKDTIEERTKDLLPASEVWMISAMDELCRAAGEKRPAPELEAVLEEQFSLLRRRLEELTAQKAESVVIDRMQRLTAAMIQELGQELDVLEQGLSMSVQEAAAQREVFRRKKDENAALQSSLLKKIDEQIASFKLEAADWMGEFLGRIGDETQKLATQPEEVLRKYYEIYCIDLLENALTVCTELHQAQLYELLDDVSSELSRGLAFGTAGDNRFGFRFKLDNRIWTKGDTAGLVINSVSFGGIIGAAASLAADGIAGAARHKETEKRKPELLQKIALQMTELTISMREAVETVYTQFGEKAKALVQDYYADQLAAGEHALEAAVRMAAKEEEKKDELRRMIQTARNLLQDANFMTKTQETYVSD